jgi:hypothetical protein
MHSTLGILRHLRQAFSTPEQNPALEVLSTPAPAPVTQTVRRLLSKMKKISHSGIADTKEFRNETKHNSLFDRLLSQQC